MTERRRGLGRGLGALIPAGAGVVPERPVDVFFPEGSGALATTALAERPPAAGVAGRGLATESDGGTGYGGDVSAPEWDTHRPPGGDATPADDELIPVPGAVFAEIPVGAIAPNSRQPRQVFDEDDLDELVTSIREVGVLQPIVVRPADDSGAEYELIMGERRWRAAELAGLGTVPAIVRMTPDADMLRDALLENLHRVSLNPLEEAAAYQQLLEDFSCTQEELASRIARSRPQISNTIRLLRLPPAVQRRVAAGVLSAGHARALLGLTDPDAQDRLAQRVVAEGLSVRATEEIVALSDELHVPQPRRRAERRPDPLLNERAARLSDHLDTRVRIDLGRRKGRIAIEFATVEDLDRILSVLTPPDGESVTL